MTSLDTETPFKIYASDWKYMDSPDAGPDCLCSRCGKPILDSPLRYWPEDGSYEYRYHPACLGLMG
ncbi:MAG TPA: hypothetical protein VN368_02915 [Candidatus Methylomirabilis sp.]|nr:hypothetical protein [Candidatus Methylomirabilis sp.]